LTAQIAKKALLTSPNGALRHSPAVDQHGQTMTQYTAPSRDTRFVAHERVGLDQRASWPGLAHCTAGMVGEVIAQASRCGGEVLAALNAPDDQQGARWHDTRVTTPDGFAEAYRQYVATSFLGRRCSSATANTT
jgi:hypothetical protein